MKYSKAVYVTKQDLKSSLKCEFGIYSNRIERLERDPFKPDQTLGSDFACQYNSKRDNRNEICTCRRTKHRRSKYYHSSHQVYRSYPSRYLYSKGFADIGVGSVKALSKKRVKRIYVPDLAHIGVGSSELTSFIQSKKRSWGSSYYEQKKTSSKCVGGAMVYIDTSVLDKKLSPLIQTKSNSTSPEVVNTDYRNINSGSYTVDKRQSVTTENGAKKLKTDKENLKQQETIVITKQQEVSISCVANYKTKESFDPTTDKKKINYAGNTDNEKNFSSDSLVQHIYNLENPSLDKQSRTSLDLMENKLEREYRKIFSMKPKLKRSSDDKPIPDFKSASLLRRRFEALRQGLGRKKDSKKESIVIKTSSHASVPSHKDVSIVSDPPSLEARSFSKTKLSSPKPSCEEACKTVGSPRPYYKKSFTGKKETCSNWSTDVVDSEYQGVKGMFRLWGKKFNLDEENCIKTANENFVADSKIAEIKQGSVLPQEEFTKSSKKEGKMFSFFRKKSKNKDKSKLPYKSKKGVTTGRCEVGDGLMIKIGVGNEFQLESPVRTIENVTEKYSDILRETWLKKFVANKIDSRNSAHIRWNNKMYGTSSSTVFELMDCVYKNINIIPRSKSEINTGESSLYYSYTKPRVNFMQDIKAWMIPKTILDIHNPGCTSSLKINNNSQQNKNIEVKFSNRKWFIDKSKAFSQNIEIVLHSNNLERLNNQSSEYITINIPEGYFSDTASDNGENSHTSDEQVYKIVEYETPKSSSYLKSCKKDRNMNTGDYLSKSNDIEVTVSVKDSKNMESKVIETIIKRPPLHRDVVVQGSNVYIPKRCDVIGIGIITQKDLRDIKKPILKIQDYLTDEESEPNLSPQKKCEFAESYLQDYYRNCTPLGIDLFSWCVSDSQLRGSSENNSLNSLNNQGDGSKSCPNIYDDYQASTIVSSCDTSSCSQCRAVCEEEKKQEDSKTSKFFGKFKKKSSDNPVPTPDNRRILPKDSLEVFKRRKMYAASNKSNWGADYDRSEPYSVPSVEDKCAQNDMKSDVGPKTIKPCCRRPEVRKKTCPKRVLLADEDTMNELLSEQLTDRAVEGILTFKGAAGCEVCNAKGTKCPKHARVLASPICEIPQPQCKESCLNKKSPACSKKNSPTCNVPKVPSCPSGPPSPCQKPCPPTPPPCAMTPPCIKESPRSPCESLPTSCPKRKSSPPCPNPPPPSLKRGSPPRSPSPKSHLNPSSPCAPDEPHLCRPKPLPPRIHSPNKNSPKRPCRSPPKRPPKGNQCGVPDCPSKSSIGQSLKAKPCDMPDCPSISSLRQSSKTKQCSIPDCPSKSSFQQYPKKNRSNVSPRKQSKVKQCDVPDCPSKSSMQRNPKQCDSPSKFSIQQCPTPPPGKCRGTESGLSLTKTGNKFSPKNSFTKCANAVKHLIDKVSSLTMRKGKECKPDCANRTKLVNQRPSPPRQEIHSDESCRSKTKQTGLHLRKMPVQKKSCDVEYVKRDKNNIIRLNSKEEILIKLKQRSPSTEEIREGCNIKVQDEDGQTLYERRDYRKSDSKNRTFLVRDMYRDSQVNRVTTPNLGNDNISDKKSLESNHGQDQSISNIVEINLTLKFKQKDKTAEVNINNGADTTTDNQETNTRETQKEVYVVQNESKKHLKENDNNDLNIKITIKNYRQNAVTNEQTPEHFDNDEFTKKISEKFNTVSTGYSEVLLEPQAYSMHKTTIDLTTSKDNTKIETEVDKETAQAISKENILSDLPIANDYSNTDQETVKLLRSEISVKYDSVRDNNFSTNEEIEPDAQTIVSKTASYVTDNKTVNNNNTTISDKSETSDNESKINHKQGKRYPLSILKSSDKAEKKEILKKIFETASNIKEHKKKAKMKQIRQMLHAILTSDSDDHEEEDVSISNKLADELTYASLKPNYFRDTDSMTNYCQFDSISVSDKKSSKSASEEQLYPTAEDNTETSESSSSTASDKPACLCSHVAARLNVNQIGDAGCCCRRMEKKNEETSCDLQEDYQCLNYNNKYVNVETQDSKYASSRIKSVVMTNMSTTVRIQSEVTSNKSKKFDDEKNNQLIRKRYSSSAGRNKECHMTTFIKNIRDHSEDGIVILESNSEDSLRQQKTNKPMNTNDIVPTDILQLNETKKAVLEIYAEKTISDKGQRIVARLPKFVSNRESEMRNYQEVLSGFKHISRRNIVMLSITR